MRVVFDANVLVSAAILPNSVSRRAVDLARSRGVILVSTTSMLEIESVLRRPKFDRYVSLENRLLFVAVMARDSDWVEIRETIQECRDPKDDLYLELAVSGRADFIVSGDDDLRSMSPFRGISIVSPTEFVAMANPPTAT